MNKSFGIALAVSLVVIGCGGGSGGGSGENVSGERAFVIATDFQTGAFATIGLDEPRAVEPAGPERQVAADAVARVADGLVYVLNRFLADNVQVLDPGADFATRLQCSVGAGGNPHDIAVVSSRKAYVTLFDASDLLVVDPSASDCSRFILGRINLAAFADGDGIPEMDQMVLDNGLLYVTLERLDRNNFFAPAERGGIVVIDIGSDQVEREITLTGENPFAATKGITVRGRSLLIAQVGRFAVNDGGIEQIDIPTPGSHGFIVTEAALGGDITDFVIVSDRRAYAVISKSDFTNEVVVFDPSTGTRIGSLLSGADFVADIELNDRDEIYLADRSTQRPGIRIFRASDGAVLTPQPIEIGLPPFEIVFLE